MFADQKPGIDRKQARDWNTGHLASIRTAIYGLSEVYSALNNIGAVASRPLGDLAGHRGSAPSLKMATYRS